MSTEATAEQQEPRTKTAAAAVTVSEKADIALVSAIRGISESDLLRDRTLASIREEASRLREAAQAVA